MKSEPIYLRPGTYSIEGGLADRHIQELDRLIDRIQVMLGAFPGSRFRTEALRLEPGDTILAYTDGVTEAMDPEQALYSGERLLETVRPLAGTSPRALVEAVGDSVKAFANGALQSDDVTLLAVRYTGP